ncbi:hypothetical protein [Streptomyces sp. NPDC048436]|uniref:hypothetical protein n=1 Tax=Streptomyces sp. NPDC048436 TaxID=3365550 RepID=UPI003711B694
MATRETRPQGGATCTALLAMAFLFLVPLLGIEVPSGTAAATASQDRGAATVVLGPYADSRDAVREGARDGGRGCHEGGSRAPGGVLPAPERTGSAAFVPAPAPYAPREDVPALPGASPADATSVDLYRTQVIRT